MVVCKAEQNHNDLICVILSIKAVSKYGSPEILKHIYTKYSNKQCKIMMVILVMFYIGVVVSAA